MPKYTIEDAQKLANEHAGFCLSTTYINGRVPMAWQCSEGHIWPASFTNIKNKNSWCPYCDGQRIYGIKTCQEIAEQCGGKCLSDQYKNAHTHLNWQCSKGHIFPATYNNVHNGKWCPECAKKIRADKKRLPFEKVKNKIEALGGKLLSVSYINNSSKLDVKCKSGHLFPITYASIQSGHWCSECSTGKNQKQLFSIIQTLFPDQAVLNNFRGFGWLKTVSKGKMELDIYVPALKLAIEYDGQQHFMPTKFVQTISDKQAEENFKAQKKRDKLKNKRVKEHPEDVQFFIRFSYKDKITEKVVRDKLKIAGLTIT